MLKRWAESVVRQLNTIKRQVEGIRAQSELTWGLSLDEIPTSCAVNNGVEMGKVLLDCLLVV